MKGNTIYIILTLFLTMLFSCTTDEMPVDPEGVEYVDAIISLSSAPASYAMSDDEEKMIRDIDLLVFQEINSEERFSYRVRTAEIKWTENGKEFIVPVKKSMNNEKYRFVILANATEALDAAYFVKGDNKEMVSSTIISKLSENAAWDATESSPGIPNMPLPMWGESPDTYAIDKDLDIHADLLRALARVDVVVMDEALNKFRLTDVYVYNRMINGRVIPEADNLITDVNGKKIAEKVSLPVEKGLKVRGPLQYISPSKIEYSKEIYLYEADSVNTNNASDATCFVIGGYYDVPDSAKVKSYYRVDLHVEPGNPNFRPILRNYQYIIDIVNVSGAGGNTPEEAFEKLEAGMTVKIESWEMGGSNVNIQPYKLSISRSSFDTIGSGEYTGTFEVMTDYPKGWTASASSPDVTLSPESSNTKGKVPVTFTVKDTAPDDNYIDIVAGTVSKRIKIKR